MSEPRRESEHVEAGDKVHACNPDAFLPSPFMMMAGGWWPSGEPEYNAEDINEGETIVKESS